jgi:hypothetical protein
MTVSHIELWQHNIIKFLTCIQCVSLRSSKIIKLVLDDITHLYTVVTNRYRVLVHIEFLSSSHTCIFGNMT